MPRSRTGRTGGTTRFTPLQEILHGTIVTPAAARCEDRLHDLAGGLPRKPRVQNAMISPNTSIAAMFSMNDATVK